jgi:chloramphenicol-sensitive protein RarD
MRAGQWLAVSIAAIGVAYLTFIYGALPWIALTLAFSFGLYGLIRKTAALDALAGLGLETAWLFLIALSYVVWLGTTGQGAFGGDISTSLLLVGAGVATALPLLLFGLAARLINLTTIGILQYIAPTLQFLLGVFVYGEAFSQAQLLGFGLIWSALLIYTIEGINHSRRRRAALRAAPEATQTG